MTSSADTDPQSGTQAGVMAAALLAVASHVAEHRLAFYSVDGYEPHMPLVIHVHQDHHLEWLATVNVTDVHEDRPQYTGSSVCPKVKTVWDVVLPDTGTRARILCWRDVPFAHGPANQTGASLELVSA